MKLEHLVPSPDLCRKIPQRAFANSALVYTHDIGKSNLYLAIREDVTFTRKDMVNAPEIYPAPTLDEICHVIDGLVKIDYESWTIESCQYERNGKPLHVDIEYQYDETTTESALRMWLIVNGIEL